MRASEGTGLGVGVVLMSVGQGRARAKLVGHQVGGTETENMWTPGKELHVPKSLWNAC